MQPWILPSLGVGWLFGVGIGSLTVVAADVLTAGLAGAAVLYAVGWKEWRSRLLALAVLVGSIGIWHANGAILADARSRAAWEQRYGTEQILRGVVKEAEPRGASLRILAGDFEDLPGFLRTTVPPLPGLREGSRVRLRGKVVRPEELRPPGTEARGDLERTFARAQVFGAMRFPDIEVEQIGTPARFSELRGRFRMTFLRALPEPAAGLYSAILLSFSDDLPRDLRDAASATGILHLVAISGSHIAVIAGAVFFGATALGFSRRFATGATLALTIAFLALVGFPESGTRSALMVGLVMSAYLLGRPAAGLRMLLLAVVAMTALEPRMLLGDVGFQLSALAVWGLLVIFPIFQHVFQRVPDPLKLRSLFFLTVAAELATLPVVAYTFGRLPVFGPLTNVAAGVLFPVLLLLGGTTLSLGLLVPGMTQAIAPVATTAAHAFLGIAVLGSRVPGHVIALPPISQEMFLTSLALLFLLAHGAASRFLVQRA